MKALLLTLLLTLSVAGLVKAQTRHYIPNSRLTPGDALKVTADDLCKPGHTEIEGNISVRLKSQVFDRYGIRGDLIGYKVEHLIPPELGGSNSLKNLWPQPLAGEWTYHMKNRLERRLGKLVCNGALDLKIAQREIAADWIGAYKKYFSAPAKARSKSVNLKDVSSVFNQRFEVFPIALPRAAEFKMINARVGLGSGENIAEDQSEMSEEEIR